LIRYYEEYKSSSKDLYAERKKEYYDAYAIAYVHRWIKDDKMAWRMHKWEERRGELILYQHPFYLLDINARYRFWGLDEYMGKGDVDMAIGHSIQVKTLSNNLLSEQNSKQFLHKVDVISKLHQN
jgi:hypothetical protein